MRKILPFFETIEAFEVDWPNTNVSFKAMADLTILIDQYLPCLKRIKVLQLFWMNTFVQFENLMDYQMQDISEFRYSDSKFSKLVYCTGGGKSICCELLLRLTCCSFLNSMNFGGSRVRDFGQAGPSICLPQNYLTVVCWRGSWDSSLKRMASLTIVETWEILSPQTDWEALCPGCRCGPEGYTIQPSLPMPNGFIWS